MLGLYLKLFKRLNEEVPYAVWKASHELPLAINGQGDMDLLVSLDFKDGFKAIVEEFSFVNAEFSLLKFPYVEHWYGLDAESGQICHLHVYYKIVTGASHSKSYWIPIEDQILRNRFLNTLNVYEACHRDQALLYSMRHYMKRASLAGFLLWTYERNDYLEEYAHIKKFLNGSVDSNNSLCPGVPYRGFEFEFLDMGIGFSGYIKAKRKVSYITNYRRFTLLTALRESIRNFIVRLYIKFFRVRKRLAGGLVLAVSGVDGSGKSSMVEELNDWFGKHFCTCTLHLGKPSPSILTSPLRPLLSIYRSLKGQSRESMAGEDDAFGSTLKSKKGFVWGLRYLALAYERFRLARKARKLADKGGIVICDRYPTLSAGKMDSPRIAPGGSELVERMRHYELQLYARVPKADGLIFLDVSEEMAIKRNRGRIKKDKETDEEIAQRHKENQGLDYCANQMYVVDADFDYDSVLRSVKSVAWECISMVESKP